VSSFRDRFGKLTVAQAIEMNNVAWKYQQNCDWSPDYEYEVIKTNDPDGKKWENCTKELLEAFKKWADN